MNRSAAGARSEAPRRPSEGGAPLSDPSTPALGPSRQAVLHTLRRSPEPLGVAAVAALTHLHPNTVRFHLDALVEHALAVRTAETRTSPGRPRVLFAARPDARDQRSYGLLAEMLAGLAGAADDARGTAIAAGRSWGRRLVERPAVDGGRDAAASVDGLHRVFEDIGFRPETTTEGGMTTILLPHCPFREVAARHPEVVCGLHLGIMEGALDGLGGAAVTESLDPFVTPSLCVAQVRSATAH